MLVGRLSPQEQQDEQLLRAEQRPIEVLRLVMAECRAQGLDMRRLCFLRELVLTGKVSG